MKTLRFRNDGVTPISIWVNGGWVELAPGEMTQPTVVAEAPAVGYMTMRYTLNPDMDEPSPVRLIFED